MDIYIRIMPIVWLFAFILANEPLSAHCRMNRAQRNKTGSKGHTGKIADVMRNVIMIHKNLLSASTYKIFISFFPLYVSTRMADERIQSNFYCSDHHKNCHQMPGWCKTGAKWGIGIPIALLGSQAFLSSNPGMQVTSEIFLTGMPFVIFGKDILKKLKANACLRPKCEFFCPHKKTYGGCPSGHMAEATYMLVLYGLEYGIKYTLPLAATATFVAAAFINCNRHFSSQIIAGAAWGAVYACAAHKVISSRLSDKIHMNMCINSRGNPGFSVCYQF